MRLLATWLFFIGVWIGIVVAAAGGDMPLWLGGLLSFAVATTFYMPLHEATHGNVWGDVSTARWGEDLVGTISAVWVGFSYKGHRISHMKHHAHTNDPERDPDWAIQGPLRDLPIKLYGAVLVLTLLPSSGSFPRVGGCCRLRSAPRSSRSDSRPRTGWSSASPASRCSAPVSGSGSHRGAGLVVRADHARTRLARTGLRLVSPSSGCRTTGPLRRRAVAVFPGSTIIIRGHDHPRSTTSFRRSCTTSCRGGEIGPQLTATWTEEALGTGPVGDQAD